MLHLFAFVLAIGSPTPEGDATVITTGDSPTPLLAATAAYQLQSDSSNHFVLSYAPAPQALPPQVVYFNGTPTSVQTLAQQFDIPLLPPVPYPETEFGNLDYYKWRQTDYEMRAALTRNIEPPAPDYYLNYGDKYITRFTNKTNSKLSDAGKKWLIKTRLYLQLELEQALQANPMLELNSEAFEAAVLELHIPCYDRAGLFLLPLRDKLAIIATPDTKDLLNKNGRKQALQAFKLQLKFWREKRKAKRGKQ